MVAQWRVQCVTRLCLVIGAGVTWQLCRLKLTELGPRPEGGFGSGPVPELFLSLVHVHLLRWAWTINTKLFTSSLCKPSGYVAEWQFQLSLSTGDTVEQSGFFCGLFMILVTILLPVKSQNYCATFQVGEINLRGHVCCL